jgi:hypothetical protein
MTTYAVIRKTDQVEVYRYSADAPVEWAGMEFAEFDHTVVPDPVLDPPPAPVYQWEPLVFLRRFTVPERVAARATRVSDPILNDFFSLLEMAPLVHSNDPDVQAGMGYLVAIGIVTPTRRDEIMGVA